MHFSHHPTLWQQHPELVAGVLHAEGIHPGVEALPLVERFQTVARERLAGCAESELPEIQAWRRVFARMGLKPTQYRCASEALLRRFRKEGVMPRLHPLVDVCNAASMAWAIPVAALDTARIAQWLQVRPAQGDEHYEAFSGEMEHPDPGEVTFVDAQNRAHARRWTNRQSGLSAVRESTAGVLIVCEAVHADAARDVPRLVEALAGALHALWGVTPRHGILTAAAPRFDLAGN
jgi:DNA/RNA-binding domain of Phe-tRNA-synthetase-like protein